jgi:ribosome-associated toxin RatA of RatAB toxin-antitoxin module
MEAPCDPTSLFTFVDQLTDYPAWMPLAHEVQIAAAEPDGRLAWDVELRARVGPFARSKRLRMVRTQHDAEAAFVRFERVERDGRRHSPWVLDARVVPTGDGCRLDMHLHYGGALWTGGVMERVLADQIVAGRERLLALVGAADR